MTFVPLHTKSHYSIQRGIAKPEGIVAKCKELGYKTCAITDLNSLSGSVEFAKECQDEEIRPIFGCVLELFYSNTSYHLLVLAKNKTGWKQLIKVVSAINANQATFETFAENSSDVIVMSGGYMSHLYNLATKGDMDVLTKTVAEYKMRFRENFFVEIQRQTAKDIADRLREAAKIVGVKCVASSNSYYVNQADAIDQRVILCSLMKTTLRKVSVDIWEREPALNVFFTSDQYFIPAETELTTFTQEEIDNTALVASLCEEFSIMGRPLLPKFDCPNGMDEATYLLDLCNKGWEKKIAKKKVDHALYKERLDKEIQVIHDAGLEGYFLIVQDYVRWAKNQGWLVGPGRGSAGGCIVAYLLDITTIDPIEYDLLFERFYNAGRNTKDRVSLPDIDVDFPSMVRDKVIQYIKDKYGPDKTSQMCTFGRMKGSSAIKEVVRIHEACDTAFANKMTKGIPEEGKISDKLEETKETSILRWVLEYEPKLLKDYCVMNEDGSLSGEYATYFEQAIRIEGIYKSVGKHAAGVVVCGVPLTDVAPMFEDRIAMEMESLEDMGLVKLDVLAVASLDKLMLVNKLLRYGRI